VNWVIRVPIVAAAKPIVECPHPHDPEAKACVNLVDELKAHK